MARLGFPRSPPIPLTVLAYRCTVKLSTGYLPFYLLHSVEAVLPIECEVPTWSTIAWEKDCTTEEFLRTRAEQIERPDVKLDEAEEQSSVAS